MEEQKSLRYRVNVSTSVKGIKKWDCTVEGVDYMMEEVLDKSDALVSQLEKHYPLFEEGK
jgi:hypothetical protein